MKFTHLARLSVRRRLAIAVAGAVGLSLIIVGLTLFFIESRRVDQQIEAGLSQELAEIRTLQTGTDPETQEPFASAERVLTVFLQRNLPSEFETMYAFGPTGDPLSQAEGNDRLEGSTQFRAAVEDLRVTGGSRTVTAGDHEYRVAVQPLIDQDGNSAFVVAVDVSAAKEDLHELALTYSLLAALMVIAVSTLASRVIGRLLEPLRTLQETARGISEGDLTTRTKETGNNDVTDVQVAFNEMLDRVENAFTTQRQLLDDAGHELRTPLTVLRGHLEVLDTNDQEDVQATRELLLDEIQRMSRLVDDLLMLAKARRPDFVRPERVAAGVLTSSILDRARGLAPRTWVLDQAANAEVFADPQRITQALLQLAHNAAKHTHDDDEIGIGSQVRGDRLELWVRDTGPGVDESMRAEIFERFARVDDDDEGFGLGLSIVRAIATAHRGEVLLDPVGASGATFRITIPIGESL